MSSNIFRSDPGGATEGEMGGMGPTIFLTAALARPRVKYVQHGVSAYLIASFQVVTGIGKFLRKTTFLTM